MNVLEKYFRQKEIEKQAQEAAKRSAERIIENIKTSKPLDPEFAKILNDNILDLF